MPSNHRIFCRHFSSCPQSFLASGSFQMSQLFTSGGQSIGASASASVFPMTIQGWFSLGLTGLISLQSKGLSTVFSRTTVLNYQFFSAQPFYGQLLQRGGKKKEEIGTTIRKSMAIWGKKNVLIFLSVTFCSCPVISFSSIMSSISFSQSRLQN